MNYLTLDLIKHQLIIDASFTDDDVYLEHLGDTAEELIQTLVDDQLDDIAASNDGVLPKPLIQAMLLAVDYLYGSQRGSNDANPELPKAITMFTQLYRTYYNPGKSNLL